MLLASSVRRSPAALVEPGTPTAAIPPSAVVQIVFLKDQRRTSNRPHIVQSVKPAELSRTATVRSSAVMTMMNGTQLTPRTGFQAAVQPVSAAVPAPSSPHSDRKGHVTF